MVNHNMVMKVPEVNRVILSSSPEIKFLVISCVISSINMYVTRD